jgi:hypothetical protein
MKQMKQTNLPFSIQETLGAILWCPRCSSRQSNESQHADSRLNQATCAPYRDRNTSETVHSMRCIVFEPVPELSIGCH